MLEVVTPASSTALVTLSVVKDELGVTTSAQDTRLNRLILEVSDTVAILCNRDSLIEETVTETWRLAPGGRWQDRLILERELAAEIDTVTVDGVELTDADWELDKGSLYLLDDDRRIPWTGEVIVVEYTAGFDPAAVPTPLRRAALDLLRAWWGGGPGGRDTSVRSEASEGVGQVSYFDRSQAGREVPQSVMDALSAYKRLVVG